jgi:hypothetical protein
LARWCTALCLAQLGRLPEARAELAAARAAQDAAPVSDIERDEIARLRAAVEPLVSDKRP